MSLRMSGLTSGIDTDSVVEALVSDVKEKKESYEKKKTKLEWTQAKWKSLNTKIVSLYNSIGTMRWSSAYNTKKTTISDSTKASVTATNSAVTGTQTLNILKVAQSGYLTGGKLQTTASTSTTLAELGYTGGDGTINVEKGDGTTTAISVSASTTISDLTSALSDAGLNASLDTLNQRIFVSSKKTGTDNDFDLIAGNSKGLEALQCLGLNTSLSTTTTNADGTTTTTDTETGATYKKFATYATDSEGSVITDTSTVAANIEASLATYKSAKEAYDSYTQQIANIKAVQGYGSAYAGVKDFQSTYTGIDSVADENSTFTKVVQMSSTKRGTTLVSGTGDSYKEYTKVTQTDSDGNALYSDGNGNYVKAVVTYKDATTDTEYLKGSDGQFHTKNADGTLGDVVSGLNSADLTSTTAYYNVDETATGKDADGNEITITKNDAGKYTFTSGDKTYVSDSATGEFKEVDTDGNEVENGSTMTLTGVTFNYGTGTANSDVQSASDLYDSYKNTVATASGKTTDEAETILTTYAGNLATLSSIQKQADEESDQTSEYSLTKLTAAIEKVYDDAVEAGDTDATAKTTAATSAYMEQIYSLSSSAKAQSDIMEDNKATSSLADLEGDDYTTALNQMVEKAITSANVVNSSTYNTDSMATKIDGTDALIKLNGVEYTSDSNNITVNGITISAKVATGDGDTNAISISTEIDASGIYDKIKDMLSEFNTVMKEMVSEYNAEYVSSTDYQPLTDDEKEDMTDDQIEEWEEKIKGSLLRHDSTLNGVINTLTNTMFSSIEVNGKSYVLSSFGIHTEGYLNSSTNEQYNFHIDGDEDDEVTSGNDDKLLAAINEDPETVTSYFQTLAQNLYKALGNKLSATTTSSSNTVYADKQMSSQIEDYEDLIDDWEDKLEDKEDYYYEKFSTMESSLATLNSTQSSLSSYFS